MKSSEISGLSAAFLQASPGLWRLVWVAALGG